MNMNSSRIKSSSSLTMKKHFCLLVVTLFFSSLALENLVAQSGNESLKKLQSKFNSLTDFSATFSQSITDQSGKSLGKTTGKFFYKRKNKFCVELKNGSITSDSENVWNYDQKQKRVVISYFSDEPTTFSLERYIFDYPAMCRVKSTKSGGDEEVIELTPKDNGLDILGAKIWKNTEGMISKLEVIDLSEVKYQFQFSDIKVDQQIPDSKFNFIPPKGTKIIDLR